jgi:hypothetical protein
MAIELNSTSQIAGTTTELATYVPELGQLVYLTDSDTLKRGDGIRAVASLAGIASSGGGGGSSEILGQLTFFGWTNAFTNDTTVRLGSPAPAYGRGYEFATVPFTNGSTSFSTLTEEGDHGITFANYGVDGVYSTILCEPGLYSFYLEHRGTTGLGASGVVAGTNAPYIDFHSDPDYDFGIYTYPSTADSGHYALTPTILMSLGGGTDTITGIDWEISPPSGGWAWTVVQFVAVRHY